MSKGESHFEKMARALMGLEQGRKANENNPLFEKHKFDPNHDYLSDAIKRQEEILNTHYNPAPKRSARRAKRDLRWEDFTDLDNAERQQAVESGADERLQYWLLEWAKPVDVYGAHENRVPQSVFFSILEQETGITRQDFDWSLFRRRYFRLHPEQFPKYKAHNVERKKNGA